MSKKVDPRTFVCRPVTLKDTQNYIDLAFQAGHGLVSIPKNPETLAQNVVHATQSLDKSIIHPKDEHYHFVLENTETKEIGGTCRILAKTGTKQPTFFFRREKELRKSVELKQDKELELLRLVSFSYGPSELASLYLKNSYRSTGMGRILSLSRILFIADNRERFDSEIIAEMRGVLDDEGTSPFWSCIGGHFTDLTCPEALSQLQHGRYFIPKVLPHYPIYTVMLPHAAQNVLGKVHPHTEPALKMLMGEGFEHTEEIDVFDGGPKISATTDLLRLIENSHVATVDEVIDKESFSELPHLISNRACKDYRCVKGKVYLGEDRVKIDHITARSLLVDVGSSIRFGHCRPMRTD